MLHVTQQQPLWSENVHVIQVATGIWQRREGKMKKLKKP